MKFSYFIAYLFAIISSLLLVYSNEQIPSNYHLIIFLNLIVHLIAFIYSFHFFNVLKVSFVFYFSLLSSITYAYSPLFLNNYDFQLGTLDYSIFDKLFIGFLIFYLLYFVLLTIKIKRTNKIKSVDYIPRIQFKNILYISIFIFILVLIIDIPINGFNEYLKFLICGLFLIGYQNGINPKGYNFILLLLISIVFLQSILTGLIYNVIYFSLFLTAILLFYFSKKIQQILIIIIFVAFIAILSTLFSVIKMDYRVLSSDKYTSKDKIIIIYDLIIEDHNFNYASTESKVKGGPIWRLSYPLSAISQVSLMTPRIVPYWNGESYINVIYKIIPRFLWPNKPNENMGQIFGHKYSFLSDDNLITSMNAPLICEAYMNFGNIGFYSLFVLMAILMSNIFYNMNLSKENNNSLIDYFNTIYCALIAVYFIQWESNLSMMLGKFFILYIFIIITNRLIFKTVY